MTLSILGWIYLFAFFLGLGFTFISAFTSHGHGHAGHHDPHVHFWHRFHFGEKHHAFGKPPHLDSGQPDFPIFSPLTLALSITIFGGVGTVLNSVRLPGYVTLPLSAGSGLLGWFAAFYAFFKFFRLTQSSSEAVVQQVIGKDAIVTVGIPAEKLGEITYVARGTSYNSPAKSHDGRPISRGTQVSILSIEGSVCVVQESVDARLHRLEDKSKEEA